MNEKISEDRLDRLFDKIAAAMLYSAMALTNLMVDPNHSLTAQEVTNLLALTVVLTIPDGPLSDLDKSNKEFAAVLDRHITTLVQIRNFYDAR